MSAPNTFSANSRPARPLIDAWPHSPPQRRRRCRRLRGEDQAAPPVTRQRQDHHVSLLLNHRWSAPRITSEPPRIDSDRQHRARRLRRRGGACSTWRSVQDNQWLSPLTRGKPRDPVVRGARLAERREQSRTILTACQNGEAEHLTRPASPGQDSQTLTAVLTCLTDL